MSDRQRISHNKETVSNQNIPSFKPRTRGWNPPSYYLTPDSQEAVSKKSETSQELETATREQENQDNTSFKESSLKHTNHFHNVSFRPYHRGRPAINDIIGTRQKIIQPLLDKDNPTRFETIHQNLFKNSPGTGGNKSPQSWEKKTGGVIIREFKKVIQQQVNKNPLSVMGNVPSLTTEAEADADALLVNQRIQKRFPQISTGLSAKKVKDTVSVIPANQHVEPALFLQWLANKLIGETSITTYGVSESDARFKKVMKALANDRKNFDFDTALNQMRMNLKSEGVSDDEIVKTMYQCRKKVQGNSWSWVLQTLASRTSMFIGNSQIFLNEGVEDKKRKPTLIHELIHFYTHPSYRKWVDTTSSSRFYNPHSALQFETRINYSENKGKKSG